MAKWGKGDPRWIVEERPDATNVNNWHWTEKNASPWSKERLKELLTGLTIKDDIGTCTINEVSKINGEATANNRKCKLIFFFEWDITLDWSGFIQDDNQTYEGNIEIPNLSEENNPEEVDINVSLKKNEDNAMKLKELMRKKGTSVIRQQLAQYIIELKEEFSQGLILPSKNNPVISNDTKLVSRTSNENKNIGSDKSEIINIGKLNINGQAPTKNLTLNESFKCSPEDLYRVFTIKEMVQAFTRGPCILESEKGGKFSLFGGSILGEFVELVPCSKIVKKWRSKNWPGEHYSLVTLEIIPKDDCVDILMTQTGIPENDFERTQHGWENYYWQSIKQTFGFGARLL